MPDGSQHEGHGGRSVGGSPSPTGRSVVMRQVEAACKPLSSRKTPSQSGVSREPPVEVEYDPKQHSTWPGMRRT